MADRAKVLITNPTHPDGVAMIEAEADLIVAPDAGADTLRRLAADVDGIIVRAKLPDDIFDAAPRVKGVVRHGVGLDFIPVEAATKRGIAVANLPGSNTQSVAEYVFAALMALRRPVATLDRRLRAEGWGAARPMAEGFAEIGGSTIGILGVGSIGRTVARIAKGGFGMTVLGTSRRKGRMPEGVEEVDLETLFSRADAIVISCALTPETTGLVDAALIGRMKPNAILINVSRAAVIDGGALLAALRGGAIAGAALDVHDVQPLPADHPAFETPNLLLTPHIAAITATSYRNMSVGAAGEMLRILRGEDPVNFVNPECRSTGGTR